MMPARSMRTPPNEVGKQAAQRGGLLDEMSFARGVAGLFACRRLRIGDAAFDHAVALGDDLPVPAAVSAGHDPKFDIWLRRVHDRLPHSVSPAPLRLSVAPHVAQRKARSPDRFRPAQFRLRSASAFRTVRTLLRWRFVPPLELRAVSSFAGLERSSAGGSQGRNSQY
jgi:hypothetical protein